VNKEGEDDAGTIGSPTASNSGTRQFGQGESTVSPYHDKETLTETNAQPIIEPRNCCKCLTMFVTTKECSNCWHDCMECPNCSADWENFSNDPHIILVPLYTRGLPLALDLAEEHAGSIWSRITTFVMISSHEMEQVDIFHAMEKRAKEGKNAGARHASEGLHSGFDSSDEDKDIARRKEKHVGHPDIHDSNVKVDLRAPRISRVLYRAEVPKSAISTDTAILYGIPFQIESVSGVNLCGKSRVDLSC
jgi:hypothetical protein